MYTNTTIYTETHRNTDIDMETYPDTDKYRYAYSHIDTDTLTDMYTDTQHVRHTQAYKWHKHRLNRYVHVTNDWGGGHGCHNK